MLEYVLYIVLAMWVSFISNKCPPPIICLVHHAPYNHVATTLCKLHVCWLLYPWWNSLLVALVIINNIVADLTTIKNYLKMACCTMKTISGNASSFRWKIQAKLQSSSVCRGIMLVVSLEEAFFFIKKPSDEKTCNLWRSCTTNTCMDEWKCHL